MNSFRNPNAVNYTREVISNFKKTWVRELRCVPYETTPTIELLPLFQI